MKRAVPFCGHPSTVKGGCFKPPIATWKPSWSRTSARAESENHWRLACVATGPACLPSEMSSQKRAGPKTSPEKLRRGCLKGSLLCDAARAETTIQVVNCAFPNRYPTAAVHPDHTPRPAGAGSGRHRRYVTCDALLNACCYRSTKRGTCRDRLAKPTGKSASNGRANCPSFGSR